MYTALANPDMAHTIGNVTFIMTEYLRSLFPENFFNYTHIGTRIAYREYMREEKRINSRLIKKSRPILVVRPRPIGFDEDIFMARTPWMWPIYGTPNNPDRSEYIRFFRDDEKDITIGYKMNRMRVQCLCTMMFNLEIQQQNIYYQLRNRFEPDRPYWMRTSTEILLPYSMMEAVSKLSGVPMYDSESHSPRNFMNYFMAHANKYITYKANSGKTKDDFFLYYPINLELVFSDFDLQDVNKKGQIDENANISFTFTTEFNTIAMYQLSTEADNKELRANTAVTMDTSMGTSLLPMYTVDNLFKAEDKDGFKLFFTNIFNIDPDVPDDEPDILDLTPVFKDSSLKDILEYYDKNGIPYETLFNFVLMMNSKKLSDKLVDGKRDYKIELDKQRILIYRKSKASTYRILIYMNNLKVMQVMNMISDVRNKYESKEQTVTKDGVAYD